MDLELRARILAKIIINEAGCWLWQGYVTREGYGTIGITLAPKQYQTKQVHRLTYTEWREPIPPGLELDHLCHPDDGSCPTATCPHRRCANPYHVEPATKKENLRRGNGQFINGEYQRRRTHCQRGHELTPENTYRWPRDPHHRFCRTCLKIRNRQSYEKRRKL